jgi:hypothetical protein
MHMPAEPILIKSWCAGNSNLRQRPHGSQCRGSPRLHPGLILPVFWVWTVIFNPFATSLVEYCDNGSERALVRSLSRWPVGGGAKYCMILCGTQWFLNNLLLFVVINYSIYILFGFVCSLTLYIAQHAVHGARVTEATAFLFKCNFFPS